MKNLVRVDKNGTKYYEEWINCPKCGGSGYIYYYSHVEGGICFKCEGHGKVLETSKEYTPEYEAKLNARRELKAKEVATKRKANANNHNINICKVNGFGSDGIGYYVLGNSFDIKEELKDLGGKFYPNLKGWIIPTNNEKYNLFSIKASDVFYSNEFGEFVNRNEDKLNEINLDIIKANNNLKAKKLAAEGITSNYVGNIGDKIEVEVKIEKVFEYKTNYTYYGEIYNIYIMKDKENNTYVWNTGSWFDKDEVLKLKGTIKEHKEYNGVKQTVLTRCRVK